MRRIVTGIDHAHRSERVLERTFNEAETTDRPVLVVHGWSPPVWAGGPFGMGYASLPTSAESARWAQDTADELLAKALRQRTSTIPLRTSTLAPQGEAGRLLVEAGQDAGLVVVGGPNHGAAVGTMLGSTAGYVVHHAQGPVMVVPQSAAPGPFHRVVVGYDNAAGSAAALAWGLDAARRHGCPLVVLHAFQLTSDAPALPPGTLMGDYDYATATRTWLDGELTSTRAAAGVVEMRSEVVTGSATGALLDNTGPDDLLVVGSRGRGGFTGLLLGSVSTQCATHARGALVVVRPGEHRLDG